MPEIKINTNGVIQLLKSINPHKATGLDNIPAYFLDNLSEELSPFIWFFFQLSSDNDNIPVDWKQTNVVPIFFKGDKHSAVNYRPVSLTAICCKLLEHIITSNIRNILVKIKYYMIANTVLEAKDPARHNWLLAFKILLSN